MTSHFLAPGTTWHTRRTPVRHSFRYPVLYLCVDIDQLEGLNRYSPLLAVDRRAILSLRQRDYLKRGTSNLREALEQALEERGVPLPDGQIQLLTAPRLFGYVFNPVSFYYCYGSGGALELVVAEVNNTFGDCHLYIVPQNSRKAGDHSSDHQCRRQFHVSPFNSMKGDYKFAFRGADASRIVSIDIIKNENRKFTAGLSVSLEELSTGALVKALLRRPLLTWLTMPRILWQAAHLYFRKGLSVYTRPIPTSPDTIRHASPNLIQKGALALVRRALRSLKFGTLVLEMPDDTTEVAVGSVDPSPRVRVKINDFALFTRIALYGDVGVGEGYSAGQWEAPELTELLMVMLKNQQEIDLRKIPFARAGKWLNRLFHVRRQNTVEGSRRNISEHYDLSNEFFSHFLDGSMTYSSALFEHDEQSLEEAQYNKLHSIISKARISSEHRVLEIGCGWGSFAIEAVKRTGCSVTCLTLSKEQKELAEQRVAAAGLQDKIEIRLEDYRHAQGEYDRVVSIEMIEAVGQKFIPEYFANCARLLSPRGVAVYQIITMPEARIERYQKGVDWIQKHIFPGCYCPSLQEVVNSAAAAGLTLESTVNIAPHYARTLLEWRKGVYRSREEIEALGFDEHFLRSWEYYLAYCEVGFTGRSIGTHQIVFSRQQNHSLNDESLSAPCYRVEQTVARGSIAELK